jgi:hypothetical protein
MIWPGEEGPAYFTDDRRFVGASLTHDRHPRSDMVWPRRWNPPIVAMISTYNV